MNDEPTSGPDGRYGYGEEVTDRAPTRTQGAFYGELGGLDAATDGGEDQAGGLRGLTDRDLESYAADHLDDAADALRRGDRAAARRHRREAEQYLAGLEDGR